MAIAHKSQCVEYYGVLVIFGAGHGKKAASILQNLMESEKNIQA